MEEDQTCWICLCGADALDTAADEDDQCVRVCACPRVCHKRCLGRWQLQNAGKKEEKYCRFCQQRYPDWRNSLTPGEITPSTPVMAVSVRGKVYKLRVRSGPEGKEDFKRQIRQLLGFTQDMDFDVIFECKTPHNGSEKVQLHGFEAFEAASWCAAVSAAKRKKAKQEAAARAAAAAAAAAAGGGLTPMASCPAALTVPDSSRPSSSGGSAAPGAGGSSSSSDGGSETLTGPDAVPGLSAQHDVESTIAPSAFATATATAAVTGAASGCPGSSPLLSSTISEPHPPTASSLTSSSLGMFGLQQPAAAPTATHYHPLLQPAGSSLPHAIVEEQAGPLTTGSSGAVVGEEGPSAVRRGSSSSSTRRSSSCPGEGVYGHHGATQRRSGSSHNHHQPGRASYSSGSALQGALSVPVGGSGSSGGSIGGRSSRDGSEREEGGEGSGRGKVGRWLRRVLHLEGPWRGAMPAGVFMGVV